MKLSAYLAPIYSAQKSFGNKATVTTNQDRSLLLKSYEVAVCSIENNVVRLINVDQWSNTTVKHVREFLLQQGKEAGTKNQILKAYKHL